MKHLFLAVFFVPVVLWGRSQACTVSATPISFGNYDVFLATPTDTSSEISIICPFRRPRPVTIAIGPSKVSGSFNPRQMQLLIGPDRLDYNLFTNRSMSTIWGDGTGGTATVTRRVGRRPRNVSVYGRIPPGQNVSIGSYGDVVTVTITW